jgi:hypothetical protein
MVKRTIVLIAMLGLSACGSDGGSGAVTCSGDVRSNWTNLDFNFTMDLRSSPLNESASVDIVHDSGAICRASGLISGSECSGTFALSGMSYAGGGSGDPGCGLISTNTTYQVRPAGNAMDVCEASDATDCFEYFEDVSQ